MGTRDTHRSDRVREKNRNQDGIKIILEEKQVEKDCMWIKK